MVHHRVMSRAMSVRPALFVALTPIKRAGAPLCQRHHAQQPDDGQPEQCRHRLPERHRVALGQRRRAAAVEVRAGRAQVVREFGRRLLAPRGLRVQGLAQHGVQPGGQVGPVVGEWHVAQPYFLVIASSSFIYVALADLIPQLQKRLSAKETVAQVFWLLLGIVLVTVMSGAAHKHGHEHEHDHGAEHSHSSEPPHSH